MIATLAFNGLRNTEKVNLIVRKKILIVKRYNGLTSEWSDALHRAWGSMFLKFSFLIKLQINKHSLQKWLVYFSVFQSTIVTYSFVSYFISL